MVDLAQNTSHARLRTRFSRFLSDARLTDPLLAQFFGVLFDRGWDAVVFGGAIRDLVTGFSKWDLRDIDIVVDRASQNELVEACAPWIKRETRFGGLHLRVANWPIDVWRLQDTWALRSRTEVASLSDLPKTTFLTTEAVALSLQALPGKGRAVYAERFFESMASGVVDINYQENPYPELCVVRSLLTAYRLNMAIAPELCVYIARVGVRMGPADLEAVQFDHYGRVRHLGATLATCISEVTQHVQRRTSPIAPYSPVRRTQLVLAFEAVNAQTAHAS